MSLKEEFENYFIDWVNNINKDETFHLKFEEDLVSKLKPYEAFEMISEAVELVLSQKDEFLCYVAFGVLFGLVSKSGTTEMNKSLLEKWDKLEDHMSSFGKRHTNLVLDLKRWYRMK